MLNGLEAGSVDDVIANAMAWIVYEHRLVCILGLLFEAKRDSDKRRGTRRPKRSRVIEVDRALAAFCAKNARDIIK
ncbi:MAG TPA: hypothetical protein VII70_10100, partial [Steroidobacteraceae bacterium]